MLIHCFKQQIYYNDKLSAMHSFQISTLSKKVALFWVFLVIWYLEVLLFGSVDSRLYLLSN